MNAVQNPDVAALPEQADAPQEALRPRVVRGAAWTMVGYVGNLAMRFGTNLILAHLLVPHIFGVTALVWSFMTGLQMFSDIGIGPSIIQSQRGEDPAFLNTAWTIQVLRGIALAICAALAAYPLSVLYNEPQLVSVLPVAALTAVISGFGSTALFTWNRRLALRRLTLLNIGKQAISAVVMIAWAKVSPTVWVLVGGGLIASTIYTVASHCLLPGRRDRFALDRESLRALLKFGRWIFVSTALTFMVTQGDKLIFGKMIPMNVLGVYSIALMLASFPSQAVLTIGSSVVFPALSQRVQAGLPLAPVFTRARSPLLILAGYVSAGIMAAGPTLIKLVYPAAYQDAAWIVQLLAVAALFQAGGWPSGAALLALGHTRWVAGCSAAMLAGMLVLIPVGYHFFDFPGAVAGLVASEGLRYAAAAVGVHRCGLPVVVHDAAVMGWVAVSAGAAWAAGVWLASGGINPWVTLLAQSATVTVLWLPGLLRVARALGSRR